MIFWKYLKSMCVFLHLKNITYLFKRQSAREQERERERERKQRGGRSEQGLKGETVPPLVLPRYLQQLGLGLAETKNQEVPPGLPFDCQEPSV